MWNEVYSQLYNCVLAMQLRAQNSLMNWIENNAEYNDTATKTVAHWLN